MNDITTSNYYARTFKLADGTLLSLHKSEQEPLYSILTIQQHVKGVLIKTEINFKGRFARQKRDKVFTQYNQELAEHDHAQTIKNYNNLLPA